MGAARENLGDGDLRERRALMLRVRARFSARTARLGVKDCIIIDGTGGEL